MQPAEKVVRVTRDGADPAGRNIEQMPHAGRRVGQPHADGRTRLNQQDADGGIGEKEVIGSQRAGSSASDDRYGEPMFALRFHEFTLVAEAAERNSQILMRDKQILPAGNCGSSDTLSERIRNGEGVRRGAFLL
jgi:hypothetical protein